MGYYNDQDEYVYTDDDDEGPGIKRGLVTALETAGGPSPSIVAGKNDDPTKVTLTPSDGPPPPVTTAEPQTNQFNVINQIAAQLQQQYEALIMQQELAKTRLKVIDLPEAQSRDEQWRRNIVMQTVLNAQQAFGRALPWEFIEQQYMNLPGQGRLGESSPFKPRAGGDTAPEGSYNTVNGPRTLEQMQGELTNLGWPGGEDVATAYARTTKGPVTPGKATK